MSQERRPRLPSDLDLESSFHEATCHHGLSFPKSAVRQNKNQNHKHNHINMVKINQKISVGKSMICSDIWHKYYE